jgi:hypothetical protein
MTQLSRPGLSMHCTSCNEERLFEQFHSEPASCPDVLDGDCQEWACAVCGDALIIGLPAPAYVRADSIRAALSRRTTDPSEPRTWRTPAPVLSLRDATGTAFNPAIRVKHGVSV